MLTTIPMRISTPMLAMRLKDLAGLPIQGLLPGDDLEGRDVAELDRAALCAAKLTGLETVTS